MKGIKVKVIHRQRNKKLNPLLPPYRDCSPYVYFLIRGKTIVYIGQSKSIRFRIHSHNCYIKYDKIRLIKCLPEKLTYYERRWIARFQPKYNIQYTKKWTMKGKKIVAPLPYNR